jgi:ribosomal 50S subunit-associated protein YjgA (DUF615 family)
MPISQSEYIGLTCPACGARFETDAWALVDAAERSDLAQALREGSLNMATCPKCGVQTAAGAALLFHDPASRRVYFAVPPDVGEHVWRGRAQELLYQLVGSLPEDERRPYLGDIQVEQELAGVRRALLRHDRRWRAGGRGDEETRRQGNKETRSVEGKEETVNQNVSSSPLLPVSSSRPDPAPLIEALRALLAADSDTEFGTILADNPALLDDDADAVVRELADLAYANGEHDVSTALRELRVVLTRLRAGGSQTAEGSQQSAVLDSQNSKLRTQNSKLSDLAYQALLHAASADALLAATRDYPELLEIWADDDLAARIEAALDESNERLARTIEARREGLDELRTQLSERTALLHSIQELLAAEGQDAVADILNVYPILLTDTAQDVLSNLMADALARDDHELAGKATSCQALLRTVRAGLEEH